MNLYACVRVSAILLRMFKQSQRIKSPNGTFRIPGQRQWTTETDKKKKYTQFDQKTKQEEKKKKPKTPLEKNGTKLQTKQSKSTYKNSKIKTKQNKKITAQIAWREKKNIRSAWILRKRCRKKMKERNGKITAVPFKSMKYWKVVYFPKSCLL